MTQYTPSQQKWLAMREAEKAHQYNQCHGFHNYALTVNGDGIIGMTKSSKGYSAEYLEIDGERVIGLVLEWDL